MYNNDCTYVSASWYYTVSIGRVWPVEEEDKLLQRHTHLPPRTINTADDYWMSKHIPPVYFSRSSTTSPSFSSEAESSVSILLVHVTHYAFTCKYMYFTACVYVHDVCMYCVTVSLLY